MTIEKLSDNPSQESIDIAAQQLENETLAQQVKRLIKAESKLYEYQEELDTQLKEYKQLYELNKKISAIFDIRKIFEYACQYIIYNLDYERVVFFEQFDHSDKYVVCVLEGYYDQQEKSSVAGLVIKDNDPLLAPLHQGCEYLVCTADSHQPELVEYRSKLFMNEYLVYPLSSHKRPHAYLAVGNSVENAEFYRRVSEDGGALVGMGNLVGLLLSAVENHSSYANMEKALEQEKLAEAKFRGIFENSLEGIYQITRAGKFISCNPATARILGYDSPEDLIDSITDIERQMYVIPEKRQELFKLIQDGVEIKNFEVEFYRKDGSKQWVMLSVHPVFNEKGEILYIDGVLQDIADRKQAELSLQLLYEELEQRVRDRTKELVTANLELRQVTRELKTAYSELQSAQSRILQQEKMASIGQLAAGVAHEINNPMAFIISNLSSLRKYSDKVTNFINLQSGVIDKLTTNDDTLKIKEELEEQKKTLKLAYVLKDLGLLIDESLDGAERVKEIVQNLKSFSRLDEAEIKIADINQGLESTINMVWNEIKYIATVKKDFGAIPQTACNLGQLNQVFMNILVNAAHSIETKGEITITTSSDDPNIYITISDTGTGIPADKLNRIFEPFYTSKAVGKGTGLGLSIAYDIIKKHNGEIRVESELGKGTTFTVVIPVVN